jgi:uncharacterized sporulation protein YeaH/YhbH (DUF444 family)
MPFIFIDRRKTGGGKSTSNRQKLLRRVRGFIKTSIPQNIGQGGVSGGGSKPASPVKVANSALEEPWFAYSNNGEHTAVIIGNDEYDRGDEIEIPGGEGEGDGTGNGAGNGSENGEDDFIVNVARDEFLDLFYEDCELPNLTNEKYTEKLDNKFQQAGFSTTGNPSQLSIIRTYKQALGRRKALKGPYTEEKKELEEELMALYERLEGNPLDAVANERMTWIEARLVELSKKFIFFDSFDKSDLRYRKKEAKPLKTVEAVLFMVMDISGSMDESKKTIARRWFALLYGFIKRKYESCELVFVAHTEEAFEMSEDDFFSTRVNGGTMVSPALKMINDIIKKRYDPNQTNIYVSHASDGDNWETDSEGVKYEMVGEGNLLAKIRLFSYVEVGKPYAASWMGMTVGNTSTRDDTSLWKSYAEVRDKVQQKMTMSIIEAADECYPVFKKVFKKGSK